MNYNEFKKEAIKNLIEYKHNNLKIYKSGKWNKVDCGHILPKEQGEKNFLSGKDELERIENKEVKLHNYWYHLNSSQVMCINFFDKLLEKEQGKKILLKIIKILLDNKNIEDDVTIKEATFEKTLDNTECTNFDFYVELSNGFRIFWEIKYTEYGFAKAKSDSKTKAGITHREKFEKIYSPRFSQTLNFRNKHINCEEFLKNYQINRNIFYIKTKSDFSIFLIPKDNQKADEELEIIENYENAKKVYWEEICKIVEAEVQKIEEYRDYYERFYKKYFGYKIIDY